MSKTPKFFRIIFSRKLCETYVILKRCSNNFVEKFWSFSVEDFVINTRSTLLNGFCGTTEKNFANLEKNAIKLSLKTCRRSLNRHSNVQTAENSRQKKIYLNLSNILTTFHNNNFSISNTCHRLKVSDSQQKIATWIPISLASY